MTDERYNDAVSPPEAAGAPHDGEGAATPRPRTTVMQRTLVIMLHEAQPDLSLKAIAAQVKISESSVRRCLAYRTEDVKASTKKLLQTMVPDAAAFWFKAAKVASSKGYHQPAKDLMEAAGAVDAKPGLQATVNVKPTVHLSMNFGLGALKDYQPDPAQPTAIEATAVPVLPAKGEA